MKLAGIIAEFNPLHNGHMHLINETRRLTGCESVCVAMSGNFVQRGEAAILDKWTRAEIALKCGADLVIEIPTLFCLSNASQYARAGVMLLESIKKDIEICFGSESGDDERMKKLANLISANISYINEHIKAGIKKGYSYPSAREEAVKALMLGMGMNEAEINELTSLMHSPNDVLGIEYLMTGDASHMHIIKRLGAGYQDDFAGNFEYQSASGIRKILSDNHSLDSISKISGYLPEESINALSQNRLSFTDDWTDMLRYAVMISDTASIEACPSAGEGLSNLVKTAVLNCSSFDEIIKSCKSKRYTYTRISRMLMQIILGINRDEYKMSSPAYIRVLGFNDIGQRLLSEIKSNESAMLPIISNINKQAGSLSSDALKMLELDARASDIYNLVLGRDTRAFSDYRMRPVII